MSPNQLPRLEELFSRAAEMDAEDALAFLEKECEGDPALLQETLDLLAEHRQIEDEKTDGPADIGRLVSRRFTLLEKAGSGTFGDVYRAHDHRRDKTVALKILRATSAAALLHFKREFRTISQLRHPNLVELYEFFAMEDRWMFTMELIAGADFLRYVEGDRQSTWSEREGRIRRLLPQLAAALHVLHEHQLLHRDLKPANVMIEEAGRLVLLDFGLIRAADAAGTLSATMAGTPEYMSPEQAAAKPLTGASDWYSAGVMLYRALTGVMPFRGAMPEVLEKKRTEDPPPPSAIRTDTASDLDVLCRGLMSRDPEERLRAVATLARTDYSAALPQMRSGETLGQPPLVGRDRELAALAMAASEVRRGKPTVVHLAGPSGIGKSSLLRKFATQQNADGGALVLAGRCHENEFVPYPGLDGLVDALVYHLRHAPRQQVEEVLPRNFELAVRLFPVLGHLSPRQATAAAPKDSGEFRLRAFAALREMFGRLAERRRLILIIDDLQWSDRDTVRFLSDLMVAGDAPQLLLVLAYRSEDISGSFGLEALRRLHSAENPAFGSHFFEVEPLSPEETEELAVRLSTKGSPAAATITALVNQSGGNPFLIQEITEYLEKDDLGDALFAVEKALQRRLGLLKPEERRLLELVSAAAAPVESEVLQAVCRDLSEVRSKLVAARLLRARIVQGREHLEIYHDRLRVAALSVVDTEYRRGLHRDLAMALEATNRNDPEALAVHYLAAGDKETAHACAEQAAERLVRALAFNKAAEFFSVALETCADAARRRRLGRRLGDALSSAARGTEAAAAYFAAADYADGQERLQLLSFGASQLIRSGEVHRGTEMLDSVLRKAGLGVPKTPAGQLLTTGNLQLRVWLRGVEFLPRQAEDVPPEQLFRADLCGIACLMFALTDPLRSAAFTARYLQMALDIGEPYRVAMALSGSALHLSLLPWKRTSSRADDYLRRASQLAALSGVPRGEAFVHLMRGLVAYLQGQWEAAAFECDTAAALFRESCTDMAWELTMAMMFSQLALVLRGRWREVRERTVSIAREAQSRGDIQEWLPRLQSCAFRALLGAGKPTEALKTLEHASAEWPNEAYNIHTVNALLGEIEAGLYIGQADGAWKRLQREWSALKRSRVLSLPTTNAVIRVARGRLALAMAAQCIGGERKNFLRLARNEARTIEKRGPQWSKGFVNLLRAGVASFDHAEDLAQQELAAAERNLRDAGLEGHQMAAAWRLAQLRGQAPGSELEEWVRREQVAEPDRIASMMTPGLWTAWIGRTETPAASARH
jgi:serine/threonine protein kinase